MKTIGLIGGLSWESSAIYYRLINEKIRERLGKLHAAKCILHSFNFQEITNLQHVGKWDQLTDMMIHAARNLEASGAECILICTNTMHKMADEIQVQINSPLLHIVDATAKRIQQLGLNKVGLLGTKFTMEQAFYTNRLQNQYGIQTVIPNEEGRQIVHQVIYQELCAGIISIASKEKYKKVIQQLLDEGAEGIILGCTEIPMLIKQEDIKVPILDTTDLHASYAVEYSLK
ncbi:aspartate/glutamate racemase family protein [Thermoflavimicrobium daqui]|uniref:Aspartate racemase n=1 Tax=Thermoflavimicrobium daqui TaxID=2137476 RepID=A0A364K2E8_9BACL|nr:aspartate/glutamate racemase family protein [Thermoflavimicrobium daqui]RAL22583.1 aspartate racemase [Thermoflavimicrobium daqui]